MSDEQVIGEVIEASTTEFVAESRELHSPPAFGSFVKVGWSGAGESSAHDPFDLQPAIYALVYHTATSPVDTGRKLRAFWKDEDELRNQQPELEEWMLVTNFRAAIIGYSESGKVHQVLPPKPPKLLSRVHLCQSHEIQAITSEMHFLRTLVGFGNCPTEEVVAASIRHAAECHSSRSDFLIAAGKELARLLKDDYDCLEAIMRRVVT